MLLTIRGEEWLVTLNESRLEPDDEGATFPSEKLVVLRPAASLSTVRHELFHAYCSTLYLGSTEKLSLDDFEEIVADMMGEWAATYAVQADSVFFNLIK